MHGSTSLNALQGDDKMPIRRDVRTFARSALLNGFPASSAARALVSFIVDTVIAPFKATSSAVRPLTLLKFRTAAGALLADLFTARAEDKWAKLATDTNAFRKYPGGRVAWAAMKPAMRDAGLLDEMKGFVASADWFDAQSSRQCLRATDRLIGLAQAHGVTLNDLRAHFHQSKVVAPDASSILVARAEKVDGKSQPRIVSADLSASKPAAILSDLQRLNAYLMADGRVGGIVFGGLRRIFSNANRPDFNWQWHGRFYSMPNADRYEGMSVYDKLPNRGARARARVIRIDGQEVSEVDVSASHLTILHGLLGLPFDPETDPYGFGNVPRADVKEWLTRALGSNDVSKGGKRLAKARAACIARYPFLAGLTELGITSLDLQYHEAEILRLAMKELIDHHGIGFLPVHDALMVARGNEELACAAIRNGFERHFTDTLGLISPNPRIKH